MQTADNMPSKVYVEPDLHLLSRQLRMINRLSRAACSVAGREGRASLRSALTVLASEFDIGQGCAYVWDPPSNTFRLIACARVPERIRRRISCLDGDSAAGCVVRASSGCANLCATDPAGKEILSFWAPLKAQHALLMPLRSRDEAIGFGLLLSEKPIPRELAEICPAVRASLLASVNQLVPARPASAAVDRLRGFKEQIVEDASMGILAVDKDLTIVLWNRYMEEEYGIAAGEVLGKKLEEAFPVLVSEGRINQLKEVFASGKRAEVEPGRHLTRHHGWRELKIRLVPLRNADTEVEMVAVLAHDLTQMRRQTRDLEEGKEFFQSLVESANVLMVAVGADGKKTLWNRHAEEVLGYSREEVVDGAFPYESIYPDPDYRELILSKLGARESMRNFDIRMRAKDGQDKVISWSVVKRRDEHGRALGHLGVGIDVTEWRKLENELHRDRERLYSILNNMEECVVLENADHRVLFMNESAHTTFGDKNGYSCRNALLRENVLGESSHPCWKGPGKQEARGSNGRWYECACSTVQLPGGEEARLTVARDVTERKANERNIRRMAKLTETVTDGIIVVDKDLKITVWNPGAERIYDYSSEEAIGKPITLIHLSEGDTAEFARAIQEEGGFVGERVQCKRSGEQINVVMSVSPLEDETGEIEGYMGFVKDVTELRQTQQQLFQAQKLDSIGTLAGGIAHDFNNIMAAIISYATFVKSALPADSKLLADIEVIENSARHAVGLTRQLLGFARGGRYQPRPLNLNGVVRKTLAMLQYSLASSIVVECDLQPDLFGVEADHTQIQQMIVNLCINSRDAMPDGGTLRVTTRNVELTGGEARRLNCSGLPGTHVQLTIADTGVGMDADTVGRVFEPFFSTKGGAGLGLPMVYGIVRSHKGFTQVESTPGEGTLFMIYLPALAEPVGEQEQPELPAPAQGVGTVLVVDDEPVQRDMLVRMLDQIGYQALAASSGKEAVDIFRRRRDQINLVLLDMIMPGMSGKAVFDELKAQDPDVRVVLSSGYSKADVAVMAQQNGALGFLEKPYSIAQLSVAILRAIRAKPQAKEK